MYLIKNFLIFIFTYKVTYIDSFGKQRTKFPHARQAAESKQLY